MGKVDENRNIPENPSLSLTLSELRTWVELRSAAGPSDCWRGEGISGVVGEIPTLSCVGEEKFLRHLERIRNRASSLLHSEGILFRDHPKPIEIRSLNTFPAAVGIASSASSFAALTLAGVAFFAAEGDVFREKYKTSLALRRALASLSREGSGSSTRSFEGPFVSWEGEGMEVVPSALPPLVDFVIVVSSAAKAVGSSEAHRRVKTSPNWAERPSRAKKRFKDLCSAITLGNFSEVVKISEADSNDMHELFETSKPPFSYRSAETLKVLNELQAVWQCDRDKNNLCVVTLDAGPNIHVIVPESAAELWKGRLEARFPEYRLLMDRAGMGAELVYIGPNRGSR